MPRAIKKKVIEEEPVDSRASPSDTEVTGESMSPKRSMLGKVAKPEKKKRAPSAYNIFFKEHRPKIAKEHADMKPKDITRLVAEAWQLHKKDQNKEDSKGVKIPKSKKSLAK